MEIDRIYFYIFGTLFMMFLIMCVVYAMYLMQQKVTSVAMTSADVAFFPLRATAFTVRIFFRIVLFGFDITLLGLRLFLIGVKTMLSALETLVLMWRVPVVTLIYLIQRLRRLTKVKESKSHQVTQVTKEKAENNEPKQEKSTTADDESAKLIMGHASFGSTLLRVREAKKLLRPDVLAVQSLKEAKNFLRKKAGLEG